jgi:hypothetical protein
LRPGLKAREHTVWERWSMLPLTAAARNRRTLKGKNQLPKLIKGVKFLDGIEVIDDNQNAAA